MHDKAAMTAAHPDKFTGMIDKEALKKFVESRLENTPFFLTDLRVSPANEIVVEIDSDDSVDIEFCMELTRAIETEFSRDDEDYELEVGSAGLTSPLKVRRQYLKYIGEELDVLTTDGRKLRGVLREAGDDTFTLSVSVKEKPEGAKRPVTVEKDVIIPYAQVKKAVYVLKF